MLEYDRTDVRMEKMAHRRAKRFLGHLDAEELAKDLVQEGWLAYLSATMCHEGVRWLNVQSAMNDYCCKQVYGTQYKQAKRNKFHAPSFEELDFIPLVNLDPSVEQQVYGMEVMRHFDRAFAARSKKNKLAAMLSAVILSDGPHIARGLLPRFKLARGGNRERLATLRQIYAEVVR